MMTSNPVQSNPIRTKVPLTCMDHLERVVSECTCFQEYDETLEDTNPRISRFCPTMVSTCVEVNTIVRRYLPYIEAGPVSSLSR